MGRETAIGVLLGIFGVAGGGVLSTLLLIYPGWAGPLFYGSLAICALCVVAALFIWFQRAKKDGSNAMKKRKGPTVPPPERPKIPDGPFGVYFGNSTGRVGTMRIRGNGKNLIVEGSDLTIDELDSGPSDALKKDN